jgi:hypothetical protein
MAVVVRVEIHNDEAQGAPVQNEIIPVPVLAVHVTENAVGPFFLEDILQSPWCP